MKKLLLVLLFVPFTCLAQELNDDGTITKVVNVEMSADGIYSKINEWVAETYNSAEAVTQLNSKTKIIIKGNSVLRLKSGGSEFDYRLKHTLSISIRDKKYKMDLSLGEITTTPVSYASIPWSEWGIDYGKKMTKDQYLEWSKNQFSKSGIYKGKKLQRNIKKYVVDALDENYSGYEFNSNTFDKMVNSFFIDIENNVNAEEDDW